jgi:hypothetical protein
LVNQVGVGRGAPVRSWPLKSRYREANLLVVELWPYTPSRRFSKNEAGAEWAVFFPGEKTFDHICLAEFAQLLCFLVKQLPAVILEKDLKPAVRVSNAL